MLLDIGARADILNCGVTSYVANARGDLELIAYNVAAPVEQAVWCVHVHGRAGDVLARRRGPLGYLARELFDEIPAALARLC